MTERKQKNIKYTFRAYKGNETSKKEKEKEKSVAAATAAAKELTPKTNDDGQYFTTQRDFFFNMINDPAEQIWIAFY